MYLIGLIWKYTFKSNQVLISVIFSIVYWLVIIRYFYKRTLWEFSDYFYTCLVKHPNELQFKRKDFIKREIPLILIFCEKYDIESKDELYVKTISDVHI